MNNFVIDANVLISILISGKAGYRPILTFNTFILPDFALIELEKYKNTLKDKTRMSNVQFIDLDLLCICSTNHPSSLRIGAKYFSQIGASS